MAGLPAGQVGRSGVRTDDRDRLAGLAVPTLLVHGEADRLVPLAWWIRAATLLPDATVRSVSRCGHWPPRERPEELVAILRAFLGGGDGE